MKRRYLRLVRRAYRYLRHPHIRKRPWLLALTKPLYSRELWTPSRHSIAGGVSSGIFFAMLPIPFQMLFASLACLRVKANIPIAMATCWVSNPFTHPPLLLLQMDFGHWLRSFSHTPLPFDGVTHIHFLEFDFRGNPADFYVGVLAMAVILSLLTYPITYGLVALFLKKKEKIHFKKTIKKQLPPQS